MMMKRRLGSSSCALNLVLYIQTNALTVPDRMIMEGPNGCLAHVINPDNSVKQTLQAGRKVGVDGQYRLTKTAEIGINAPSKQAPLVGTLPSSTMQQ